MASQRQEYERLLEKNVWGYNLLAPTGGEMPHIVVKVSQLRVIQDALGLYDVLGDPDLDWWITVRNIYETSGGQRKLLTSMERGMVYRIKQLKFDESYVTPEPEMAPLDIEVIAEPIPWAAKEVQYDLN